MSGLHGLKVFVNQRLTAALREICEHVDRTVTEYEDELLRRWTRADPQQLLVANEAPPDQQRRPGPHQEDPEPIQIKQELEQPEEPWTHQEQEQLRGLEEDAVALKSENEEPLTSISAQLVETKPEREHYIELKPARTTDPDVHLEPLRLEKAVMNQSNNQKKTAINNCDLNFLINDGNKRNVCCEYGEQFRQNPHTLGHKNLFSCSICSRRFRQKLDLVHHMVHHTQQKLSCESNVTELYALEKRFCDGESSRLHRTLTEPQPSSSYGLMRTKAGEGLYRNLSPDKHLGPVLVNIMASPGSSFETGFRVNDTGPDHRKKSFTSPESDSTSDPRTRVRQTEEKPLSCLVPNKGFSWRRRMRSHTEAQPSAEPVKFMCPECGRRFVCRRYLKGHMRIHSGDARNSCSVCGKCFVLRSHLKEHMRSHTGERPFTCQLCNKSFKYSGNLQRHVKTHWRQTAES